MEWCFAVWSIDSKAWHRAQNPKELLILCNPEGMLSFGKKLEEIRANHVWKHRNSGEIPEDRFANRPAYINHTHDKSSRARNPSRYRSQAEKSNGHSYSRWCRFLYICRYVLMLSRLVDTFFSRTSWTMLLYAENHSISVAWAWEEDHHWWCKSSDCSNNW